MNLIFIDQKFERNDFFGNFTVDISKKLIRKILFD